MRQLFFYGCRYVCEVIFQVASDLWFYCNARSGEHSINIDDSGLE